MLSFAACLVASVLLLQPPLVRVRTLVTRSSTLAAAARSTEVDWRIRLVFYRLQPGARARRPLSRRSGRRGSLGGLTLQGLQFLGGGTGSYRTRCLADGRAFSRRLFGS